MRGGPGGEETQPASSRPFSADATAVPTPAFRSVPGGKTPVPAAARAGSADRCAGRCTQVSAGAEGTAPLTCTSTSTNRSPTADIHPKNTRPAKPLGDHRCQPPVLLGFQELPPPGTPLAHPASQNTSSDKTRSSWLRSGGSGCCRDHQPGMGPTGTVLGPRGLQPTWPLASGSLPHSGTSSRRPGPGLLLLISDKAPLFLCSAHLLLHFLRSRTPSSPSPGGVTLQA